MTQETKKRGRPKKHDSPAARARAWRQKQNKTKRRLDGYISIRAATKIDWIAESMGCSPMEAIEELLEIYDVREILISCLVELHGYERYEADDKVGDFEFEFPLPKRKKIKINNIR